MTQPNITIEAIQTLINQSQGALSALIGAIALQGGISPRLQLNGSIQQLQQCVATVLNHPDLQPGAAQHNPEMAQALSQLREIAIAMQTIVGEMPTLEIREDVTFPELIPYSFTSGDLN